MQLRRKKVWIAFGVIALGFAAFMVFAPAREPSYLRIPLSAWVEDYGRVKVYRGGFYWNENRWHATASGTPWMEDYSQRQGRVGLNFPTPSEAIDKIGTNALPYLCKWIQYEPPRFCSWLHRVGVPIQKIKSIREAIDRRQIRAQGSLLAFRQLGTRATPAVPELSRIVADRETNACNRAAEVLMRLGTEGLPGLMVGVTNQHLVLRSAVARHIGNYGAQARFAVPALVVCLQDPEVAVRVESARALGKLREHARDAVPALVKTFQQDPDLSVRASASTALYQIDPGADRNASP